MISCPVCGEDVTVLIRADVAIFDKDVPFCSAGCLATWRNLAERRQGGDLLRAAGNGWALAIVVWAVLFFGLWNMPVALSAGSAALSVLIGAVIGLVAFWRAMRRPGNAAGLLDF